MDESAVRMRAALDERAAAGKSHLSAAELDAAAKVVGYGAVKYFDLKQHPETDYNFSFDAMLDTKVGRADGHTSFSCFRSFFVLRFSVGFFRRAPATTCLGPRLPLQLARLVHRNILSSPVADAAARAPGQGRG